MIPPKTILLGESESGGSATADSYARADEVARHYASTIANGFRLQVSIVTVFVDLFVWSTSLSLTRADATGEHFVQRAIRADWEFNAGVCPDWWPGDAEAARMWGVHYREDHANGRADLARMRLERYDLAPLELTQLRPRNLTYHGRPIEIGVGPPAAGNGAPL